MLCLSSRRCCARGRRRATACALLGAALALLAPAAARADDNPSVRDGMPCVRRVCIGDSLDRLLHLPWLPVLDATSAAADPASALRWLRTYIRAEPETLERLAPYWVSGSFDAAGLELLSRVTAVCRDLGAWLRPRASYAGDAGVVTTVSFERVASADGQAQGFRVAAVARRYAGELGPEALARIAREAKVRYVGVAAYANATQPAVQWLPRAPGGPTLRLIAPVGDSLHMTSALGRHPACRPVEIAPDEESRNLGRSDG